MVSVLSFGGGVNSTALLLRLIELGTPPDLVLFADTGGELPETYRHVHTMRAFAANWGIDFEVVTNAGPGKADTLEQDCLNKKELPSKAYGMSGCSVKWKRQPMDRFIRDQWPMAKAAWARGEKVVRLVGIDAGETRRGKIPDDELYTYRLPLKEWGWDRAACLARIKLHGLEVPPKSACFFCPATRKVEVLALQRSHPDLLARALQLEANAEIRVSVGLGRHWKWADILRQDAGQGRLWGDLYEEPKPCACTDEDPDQE